ncbi:transcriptional regulator [Sphaerisporangium siamense]|uniref:Transcriptional regulator with XRE-family HTH domain n=1 Tax=Sphaerisporangium siamense TaxID=795645 RepID=A0A7W7D5L5_9ACTN|nr:helix-turn-helix transcriptional regulator [Sphaerisporangium siamense]MBB4700725.1 transcriptional regulator with XRE-family HTH domain [Sphaerisporangium siamense]GII88774.1 transcriptional regulator [Sphaerisporangium siamense]
MSDSEAECADWSDVVTVSDYSPTVRLRRLGHELRRLREESGQTVHDAAAALECSSSKISRLENGLTKRPDVHHVRRLCEIYGVTSRSLIDALVELAREAKKRGWWAAYSDVLTGSYVGLEAEASSIRNFELALIPGLLQTPEYAAEIIRAGGVRDPREVERRVAARMERQQLLLRDSPPQLWAVIDEAALFRPVGSRKVREAQLRKLVDTSPLHHVKLQILPFSAGPHAGLSGQFVILDFPSAVDRSVVYVETPTDGLYLEEDEQLKRYTLMFQYLCASALSVEASIAYLSNLIDKL